MRNSQKLKQQMAENYTIGTSLKARLGQPHIKSSVAIELPITKLVQQGSTKMHNFFASQPSFNWKMCNIMIHGLWTAGEEIAFTAR